MMFCRLLLLPILSIFLLTSNVVSQEYKAIKKMEFVGNKTISESILRELMNSKQTSLTNRLAFWKKSDPFSPFTLDEDILRLKKHYQQNGFLDPLITYDLLPTRNEKRVTVKIAITEGDTIKVGTITLNIKGAEAIQKMSDSLENTLPLKTETRFCDDIINASEQQIKSTIRGKGYPFVKIDKQVILEQTHLSADVTYNVSTGSKSYIGEVSIYGDSLIEKTYIQKHINLQNGELFSQSKLEETQQKLFDLALFRYVTVRAELDSTIDNSIPISIQLKELPRWSLKTGVGYGTEDKIRVSMLLSRLNFFGGGRTLSIKGEHSYFIPLGIEAKFIQPDIFTKDLDFILNPFFSREKEESYDVDRLGTALTFQKEVSKNTTAYLTYSLAKDKVDLSKATNLLTAEESANLIHNKSGVTVGFARNTTNDLFSPENGWKIDGTATYMGLGFQSEYHYYKLLTEIAYFFPIIKNVVMASKLKGGIINAIQNDISTPIEDRFLMGGALSLRGWGRNELSPRSTTGEKIGGNTMFEGSTELRFPIYSIVSGATFLDFGNNWTKSWDVDLKNLFVDAGVGLRIKTPVGPIRLDFATPIGSSNFKLQFFATIGHAF